MLLCYVSTGIVCFVFVFVFFLTRKLLLLLSAFLCIQCNNFLQLLIKFSHYYQFWEIWLLCTWGQYSLHFLILGILTFVKVYSFHKFENFLFTIYLFLVPSFLGTPIMHTLSHLKLYHSLLIFMFFVIFQLVFFSLCLILDSVYCVYSSSHNFYDV